ncbi:hypothetical protein [Comamonas sp. JUb58]|uniref:hypothetical protein n=1 Tax=Comamonas sp. JUb58 TaxID=2485114 RepID=UPI001061A2B7|nr:hypothetical protein [Comamonas sp. JUb58]TDS73410.1 hypothetical protein EDF71_12184 [Comamonas sp. JUb58]
MLKDQVQTEAAKAVQVIRAAMLEFNQATGFEMSVQAGWKTTHRQDADSGLYVREHDIQVAATTINVSVTAV